MRGIIIKIPQTKEEKYKLVLTDGTKIEAWKASGCLQSLKEGDLVSVNIHWSSETYITLLLCSKDKEAIFLGFENVQNIKARNLSINIDLFILLSADTQIDGYTLFMVHNRMISNSLNFDLKTKNSWVTSNQFNDNVYNMRQTLFKSNKKVIGKDKINAGNIEYRAKVNSRIDAGGTTINSKNLLKLDGK